MPGMTGISRLLITGARGRIGQALRAGLRGVYPALRLSDLQDVDDLQPGEEDAPGDLRDFTAVQEVMRGVDAVVHLGGIPDEAPFEQILDVNVRGTANIFEAARRAGVRRVIFASSNHAVGFEPVGARVDGATAPRPDTHYGVSKAYGEALGRLYHDKHGLAVACLRIGSFRPRPQSPRELTTWISPRDMVALTRACLDAPGLGYAVVYGLSGNTRNFADDSAALALGYAPQDNAEEYRSEIVPDGFDLAQLERAPIGGAFTARDYRLD